MAIPAVVRRFSPVIGDLDLGLIARKRIRLIRQTEAAECALACLAMIANYHGSELDLTSLRRRFQPSSRGTTLKSLIAMADSMCLSARPVKLALEHIGRLQMPVILHWDMNHFVILERQSRGRFLVHDPAGTSRWYTLVGLSQHFTGVALELRPSSDFEPTTETRRLRLWQLWERMTGLRSALAQTLILSIVLQAFVLASPFYMQTAIDSALPALDANLLTVLALGFGLFTLINVGASLLRSMVLLSAGTSLSFGIVGNVARRLFRLPVAWFEKRHVGDVLSRFQSVQPIQHALTQGAIAAILDGASGLLILFVMLLYSVPLALISFAALLIYVVVRILSFSLQRRAQQSVLIAASREQSMMIESIRGITAIRLFNLETTRHALWQNRLTDSMNEGVKLARIGIYQNSANMILFGLENVIVIWLAVGYVMNGGFSVGMVFAYLAYRSQFSQRFTSLIDQIFAFRMLSVHLERLSDVALEKQDIGFADLANRREQYNGHLELRDVCFRYGPNDPLVIDKVNLIVEPGEHIAITGPSGGGKTTLAKILLGLVEPDSGEILVDGAPLTQFGHRQYRDQIAAVLQDDHLFAGSLADNIALFDEVADFDRIRVAAIAASVHDEIMAFPMQYETLVGDMGSVLSGGQKQRLLLARALYRHPRLLVLDEATSHLDSSNESSVSDAISALGITRIVIAHRPETIDRATRVIKITNGQLYEKNCLDTFARNVFVQGANG